MSTRQQCMQICCIFHSPLGYSQNSLLGFKQFKPKIQISIHLVMVINESILYHKWTELFNWLNINSFCFYLSFVSKSSTPLVHTFTVKIFQDLIFYVNLFSAVDSKKMVVSAEVFIWTLYAIVIFANNPQSLWERQHSLCK